MDVGVILSGGIGRRFKNKNPKQFIKAHGKMLITRVIDEFQKSNFDKLIVVNSEAKFNYVFEPYLNLDIVPGGKTRNESVYNALVHIKKHYPDCKKVVFHDSVRPLIKAKDLNLHLKKLDDYKASITIQEITDSLGSYDNISVLRDNYFLIQTPEAFQFEYLYNHFNKHSKKTAIVQQLPLSLNEINLNLINKSNLKITYPSDLKVFESLLKWDFPTKQNPNLNNKNILLFGASGGIGSTTYKEILKRFPKARIFTPSREEFDLNNLNPFKLHEYLKKNKIDIIINCAGAYHSDDEGILEHYNEIMNVNLKANLQIVEACKGLNRRINIVFISSSSSTKGRENLTVYSASKAALNSIVESLADPMAKKGILINLISPEKVNTPLLKKLHKDNFELREVLQPEEVAEVIIHYSDTNLYGKLIELKKGYIFE